MRHTGGSLVPLMPETRFENLTHPSISGPFKVSGRIRREDAAADFTGGAARLAARALKGG